VNYNLALVIIDMKFFMQIIYEDTYHLDFIVRKLKIAFGFF